MHLIFPRARRGAALWTGSIAGCELTMALKARKSAPAKGRARPGIQSKAEVSPAVAARDAKPTFGKAAPKKVVAGAAQPKAAGTAAKARKPATGKSSSGAVRSAASIAVGAVVVTARGVASLAASVVGRRGSKGKAK